MFLNDNTAAFEVPAQFTFERCGGDVGEKVIANDVNRVGMSIRLAKMVTQLNECKTELAIKEKEFSVVPIIQPGESDLPSLEVN